jgi:predicted Zn-dependent protease
VNEEKRKRLARRFGEAVAKVAPGVPYRLEFRRTSTSQVNAFALPGGPIVLLDGLVEFAGSDEAVLGVLGHKLGHVVHKHGVRQVFQSMGVGVLASLLWGDFSGVAASAPIALGMLRYSRGFEGEADEFAIRFLRVNGVSVRPLYDFFWQARRREERSHVGHIPDFLATHPATTERMERLGKELNQERALSPK